MEKVSKRSNKDTKLANHSANIVNLRIHWKFSTILKISNKSVSGNVFWYVKVYIFWNFIQLTNFLRTNKKLQSKHFFLSQAPTHNWFTFNSKFLYELKYMIHLSKNMCNFPVLVPSLFIKLCIFVAFFIKLYFLTLWL